MSASGWAKAGSNITACLHGIGQRLTDAAAVATAAVACAAAGSEREAVRIVLDLDELLGEATTLPSALCLIGRMNRDPVLPSGDLCQPSLSVTHAGWRRCLCRDSVLGL